MYYHQLKGPNDANIRSFGNYDIKYQDIYAADNNETIKAE